MEFRDLKAQYLKLKQDIDKGIENVMLSSSFILGKEVEELENMLANYVNRKYCITCANGTDALQLSLMAYDIGYGDAIFTSDFTYFASASAASILGIIPIFVDIDINTFNLSVSSLESKIKETINEGKLKPKAIIAVDLFGQPADYNKIVEIAKKYSLIVIEDGAQGFGGRIKDKKSCSFGNISTTSFFPAKPLGCYGDGGAIFTDDESISTRLKSLRSQGKSNVDKYDNVEIGLNSRLDAIQAAILKIKFKAFVEYELDNVNEIANKYTYYLKDKFITPTILDGFYSSWAQYTILLNDKTKRDKMKLFLKENDVPTMIYYPRGLHQQKAYSNMNLSDDSYANTCKATNCCLSLPIHPYLNDVEIEKICDLMINKF